MSQPVSAGALPNSVKWAAALFLVYGVTVVLNATVHSSDSWVAASEVQRRNTARI